MIRPFAKNNFRNPHKRLVRPFESFNTREPLTLISFPIPILARSKCWKLRWIADPTTRHSGASMPSICCWSARVTKSCCVTVVSAVGCFGSGFLASIHRGLTGSPINPVPDALASLMRQASGQISFLLSMIHRWQAKPIGPSSSFAVGCARKSKLTSAKTKSLCWHHIEPVYLPPYSPDFNPIKQLWQHLKGHYLAGYFTKQIKDLSDKLIESIQHMMDRPKIIRSVCRTHSE